MKKKILSAIFAFCSLLASAQSPDETSIQKVCETETRAWLASDPIAFNNCWQIRPYTRILVTTEDGQTFAISADQMKAATANAMGSGGTFVNSNFLFHVEGNSAWVTYDEVKTDAKGPHPSHEMRLLEKVNGQWKIVGMSVHHYKAK